MIISWTFFQHVTMEIFPKVEIKLKRKPILSPWIKKGILRSSKRKQGLYKRFLKNRTSKNKIRNKEYKNLFETIKRKSKNITIQNKWWNIKILGRKLGYNKRDHWENKNNKQQSPRNLLPPEKAFLTKRK